ncbi:MAG: acyltransferase family protein [Lachnospiraceae bacterium]|nr:acyltransferase family protein [Lachnospiraceae bacterium]
MEGRQRDVLPDVLKGFGIVMVVLGHCIQSGSGLAYLENACYFEDRWYQFIYSFHMPLFMIISGYYAWNSVQRAATPKDRKTMLRKKCIYLITPNVGWKLIEFVYLFATDSYIYWGFGVFLKDLVLGILENFWFLWAILYAFLLVCLMHYRLRDSIWIYILIFVAMFFTPDGMALNAYKYMLPYYLIGFYGNKNKKRLSSAKLYQEIFQKGSLRTGVAVLVSGIVFLALFSFFTADSFIYLTGYKLIGKNYMVQLQIDLYRFLVGLCGIVFWIFVWKMLLDLCRKWDYRARVLAYLGKRGLGIYIISGILVLHVVHPVTADWEPRYGVSVAETLLVLLASAVIVEGMRRIRGICRLVGEERRCGSTRG